MRQSDDLHPDDEELVERLSDWPESDLEEVIDFLEDIRALPETEERDNA